MSVEREARGQHLARVVCAAGKLLQANEQGCRTHQSTMRVHGAQASMQESHIHWKLYMIWILDVDYGLKQRKAQAQGDLDSSVEVQGDE